MEGINSKRIQFFKDKIKNRLVELKPYMSDVKYRMYMSVINNCKDLEELREMVEMDMQFNMVKYLNELTDKIKLSDTSIDELEAVINQNARAAKLTVIIPKKKDKVPIYEEIAQDMDEMLEDKEVLEASANILWQRLNSQMSPELDLSDMTEEEDSLGLDDIDIDTEEIDEYDDAALEELENEEEDDNTEEKEEYFENEIDPYDDAALEEQEEEEYIDNISLDDFEEDDELDDFESDDDFEDIDDIEEEIDEYDDAALEEQEEEKPIDFGSNSNDEEVIDFGINEEQSEQLAKNKQDNMDVPDDLDLLNIDDMFGDDEDEEEELDDLDSITDEMFELEDDLEEEEEDDEFNIDDMYGDEDDFEEDDFEEEEPDEEFNLDDMYGDEEDDFEEDEMDEEEEGDDLDSIDPNDIFGGDDDEEDEEEPEEEDELNIDDMYGDEEEDEFDIDESDLDGGIEEDSSSEDDLSKLFDTEPKTAPTPIKREKTQDKIFINGTQRGKQTQDMFNAIFGFANKMSKMKNSLRR